MNPDVACPIRPMCGSSPPNITSMALKSEPLPCTASHRFRHSPRYAPNQPPVHSMARTWPTVSKPDVACPIKPCAGQHHPQAAAYIKCRSRMEQSSRVPQPHCHVALATCDIHIALTMLFAYAQHRPWPHQSASCYQQALMLTMPPSCLCQSAITPQTGRAIAAAALV